MDVNINNENENQEKPVEEKVEENKVEEKVEEKVEVPEEKPKKRRKKKVEKVKKDLGIGLDVGTMFCISARSSDDEASFKVQRDAFFDIENNKMSKGMLDKLGANYIESENKKSLYVLGDEALQMGNFFNKEIRRPLSGGVISTREEEALVMIKVILKNLVGEPLEKDEVCHFSIPASSLDEDNFNVVYHENMLKSFLTSFGYNAIPLNEAVAVGWSELDDENFTGLALSFGAGMVNAALLFLGVSDTKHQFSVSRSGDWIDEGASKAIGVKASKITAIKESGIDLLNPKTREEQSIKIYYENLISYVCNALEKKMRNSEDVPNFPEPITVVVSGGTSKIGNFEKVFEEELKKKDFPFQIKKVKKAEDQLNAVSKGCLLNSLNYYSEE